jgi:hypothetical protein
MNQAVLFNDDWHYRQDYRCWCFSGQVAGDVLTIVCRGFKDQGKGPSSEQMLDAEYQAEQWLQDNDYPEQSIVSLY